LAECIACFGLHIHIAAGTFGVPFGAKLQLAGMQLLANQHTRIGACFFCYTPSFDYLTIGSTVHLVGWTCWIQQRSAVGPFAFVTLRLLLVFNCHLESTIPSPNLKSGNGQVNLF
jgi:hypothetical protein